MLQRLIKRYSTKSIQSILVRSVSSSPESSLKPTESKQKWDLHAGVLVERLPIVTKTLKPIEKEFQQLLWQQEFEKSLKSDHELQHERDLIQAELIKKGEIEIDLDETVTKQTAQDLKDAYTEEYKKFKFGLRETEADKKNDLKSLNRKLENILYLLVEQKLGNKVHLILPQGIRQEGETMRQTAERVLREKCGDNLDVFFYGNAPCGFYKYKYPIDQRKEAIGVKVFFYRAAYNKGNIDEKIIKKFEWITHEDLVRKLKGSYSESVQKFLLE